MAGYETVRCRFFVIGAHQFRVTGMRFNVAQTERVILHVAERFRLRLVAGHEVRVIRMSRNVAALVRMTRNCANGFRSRKLWMRELREIRMAWVIAQEHWVPRNAAHRLPTSIIPCNVQYSFMLHYSMNINFWNT